MHETCHRGFISIVRALVDAGADTTHVPDDDASRALPFSRPPPQTPLGEAARCGFRDIVKLLLDKVPPRVAAAHYSCTDWPLAVWPLGQGAPKDLPNHMGWTALHEAAFYNHSDVVQLLLVYGADAGAKNNQSAVPFQLASLPAIRELIQEMGGSAAVPAATSSPFVFRGVAERGASQKEGTGDGAKNAGSGILLDASRASAERQSPVCQDDPSTGKATLNASSPGADPEERRELSEPLLHSGAMLGNLPSLNAHRYSPDKEPRQGSTDSRASRPDGKNRKHKHKSGAGKGMQLPPVPSDFPVEFLCEICERPLEDPVRTPYGNVFERKVFKAWVNRNGSICPITGQPCSIAELKDAPDIVEGISKWEMEQALQQQKAAADPGSKLPAEEQEGDSMYAF